MEFKSADSNLSKAENAFLTRNYLKEKLDKSNTGSPKALFLSSLLKDKSSLKYNSTNVPSPSNGSSLLASVKAPVSLKFFGRSNDNGSINLTPRSLVENLTPRSEYEYSRSSTFEISRESKMNSSFFNSMKESNRFENVHLQEKYRKLVYDILFAISHVTSCKMHQDLIAVTLRNDKVPLLKLVHVVKLVQISRKFSPSSSVNSNISPARSVVSQAMSNSLELSPVATSFNISNTNSAETSPQSAFPDASKVNVDVAKINSSKKSSLSNLSFSSLPGPNRLPAIKSFVSIATTTAPSKTLPLGIKTIVPFPAKSLPSAVPSNLAKPLVKPIAKSLQVVQPSLVSVEDSPMLKFDETPSIIRDNLPVAVLTPKHDNVLKVSHDPVGVSNGLGGNYFHQKGDKIKFVPLIHDSKEAKEQREEWKQSLALLRAQNATFDAAIGSSKSLIDSPVPASVSKSRLQKYDSINRERGTPVGTPTGTPKNTNRILDIEADFEKISLTGNMDYSPSNSSKHNGLARSSEFLPHSVLPKSVLKRLEITPSRVSRPNFRGLSQNSPALVNETTIKESFSPSVASPAQSTTSVVSTPELKPNHKIPLLNKFELF